MATILTKLETWADDHHPRWLDLIRMGLGVFIFMKGIEFLQDYVLLEALVDNLNLEMSATWVAHYIGPAHLFGGLLIAIGLLTRWSILAQIPILIGAVFFVNIQGGNQMELIISLVTILLLFVFLLYGSGPWSVDALLKKKAGKAK